MGGFLLDTNVISEFKRRGEPDRNLTSWLRTTDPDLLWASVLSIGEIRHGIQRLAAGKRKDELEQWLSRDLEQWFDQRLFPVTRSIAERWGIMGATALSRGVRIPVVDGRIAATAVEHNVTVVTRNTKDFAHLDIRTVNPWL